jgi:hypothetical protein
LVHSMGFDQFGGYGSLAQSLVTGDEKVPSLLSKAICDRVS